MLFHPQYEYIICGGGTTYVEHHSVVGIGYLVGTCLGCYLFVKVEEHSSTTGTYGVTTSYEAA